MTVLEGKHAVVMQACGTAPDDDVAMLQRYSSLLVLPRVAAE
jgi:hypothetical protein